MLYVYHYFIFKSGAARKPSSVVDDYLSRQAVADLLKPPFEVMWRATNSSVGVAANRVYMAGNVTIPSVSSYLAFPSLPYETAVYFCCTFPKVTLGGR